MVIKRKIDNLQYRTEKDSLGTKKLPYNAYYGLQSLRAAENFRITGLPMHHDIINSLAEIKRAAAIVNSEIGLLEQYRAEAIIKACDEILSGKFHENFIVDPIQGGAGTSINMNANEVITNRAIELLGGEKGDYNLVHPIDHVNCGQSTNDVVPTAGKMTTLKLLKDVKKELKRLSIALNEKAEEFDSIIKMGRTQMQDAVPIRLGQEFRAYAVAVKKGIKRLENSEKELLVLNMGGTAIGTGINADETYLKRIVPILSNITQMKFIQASNLIEATQNLDAFVTISGIVKMCAITLSKISNDFRLMSSGPRCGLGEINLPPKQNGSSIMPGKTNPVIPEVVNQVAFYIVGNDVTITMAAEAGQLELNAFSPIVLHSLFQSIDALTYVTRTFVDNCVDGITANKERCEKMVENSIGIITALCPHVGYVEASNLAEEAVRKKRSIKHIILEANLLKEEELEEILNIKEMTEPGISGKEILKKV